MPSPNKQEKQERIKKVLALYLHGYTPTEIAQKTGFGLRSVSRYIAAIKSDWASFLSRPIMEIKAHKLAELRNIKQILFESFLNSEQSIINSKILSETLLKILDLEIDLLGNVRLTKPDDDLDFDKIIKAVAYYAEHHSDNYSED